MPTSVDDFLAHYASKYYDPAKAREYYLKTRQLKGREPVLSKQSRQRQSEATAYVSKEIGAKKTADLKANAAQRTKLDAAANANAKAHAERMKKLTEDATAVRDAVVSKLKAHLEQIQAQTKIPANASPKQRAFLEKQRASQLNSAANKAEQDLGALQSGLMRSIDKARDDYQSFREGNSIAKRANSQSRRTISDKYRKDLETEKKNIKDQVR